MISKKIKPLILCLVLISSSIVLKAETTKYPTNESKFLIGKHKGRNGKLNSRELKMARVAWKYFENNFQSKTGLVNAVDNYPSTTMWDTASYLGALVSAYELKIINKSDMDVKLSLIFNTLNKLDLFQGMLPNKVYNTITAKKVNYINKPGEIGWSALDLGRLLIWLKIIKERYPEHSNAIDNILLKWNFSKILDEEGTMYGASIDKEKKISFPQEGRLGYEEYSAKGFQLWGFNTNKSSKLEPFDFIQIYGIDIPYDTRDPRKFIAHNYVVCESYILDAIEMNLDLVSDKSNDDNYSSDRYLSDFSQRIYDVQESRYKNTGILTARTEHQLDSAPYFVYDTIYTDGFPWNTISEDGKYQPQFSAVALKAALGLWVLWETDYTNLLFDRVSDLYDPEKGFYEGVYENGNGLIKTFTANNNGIMLEALLYKTQGKILRYSNLEGLWEKNLKDEFNPMNKLKAFPKYKK